MGEVSCETVADLPEMYEESEKTLHTNASVL